MCIFRKTKGVVKLEGEHTVRAQMNPFSGNVTVDHVDQKFKTEDSGSKDGTVTRPSPVAYINNLEQFMLDYLTKLDQWVLQEFTFDQQVFGG